jgi:hypothetical protein
MNHYKLLDGEARDCSSNENPNHSILREAILNDLSTPKSYFKGANGTIYIRTDINSAARIMEDPKFKNIYWISYVEPDHPVHYRFWVNKGTLKGVGDALRKIKGIKTSILWKEIMK